MDWLLENLIQTKVCKLETFRRKGKLFVSPAGVQAGPGPQEVQEGEGEVVDPLQAKSLPAHRHSLLSEGQGKKNWSSQAYQTISMGDMPI